MRKMISVMVLMVISLFLFAGCNGEESPDSVPAVSRPSHVSEKSNVSVAPESNVSLPPDEPDSYPKDAAELIRAIMDLDYAPMTVADFNEKIQQMCSEADTTIFDVISHTYDFYTVYDDAGEFVEIDITDAAVKQFLKTTLDYSSQEIFGEPVHMGSAMYMVMPGMTALELSEKEESMQPKDWKVFYDENISEISIYPVLSYEIETAIPDEKAITVSERDQCINEIEAGIKTYFLGLTQEAAAAETLEEDLKIEFERLAVLYSNDKIQAECRIQAIERDIG